MTERTADDGSVQQNLQSMNTLDFDGWNPPDWPVFEHFHTEDVHVEVGGSTTEGIDAHVAAMKQSIEQSGGSPMQITAHPIAFGSGEWTCVIGEIAGGGRMVTVARWRDGAIAEEYIWM